MTADIDPKYAKCELGAIQHGASMAAAGIFTILYLISFLIHSAQMIASKTWYLWALVFGCLLEVVGYGFRVVNAWEEDNTDDGCWNKNVWIIQTVLILVAPAFMSASIYMILGRIIQLTEGDKYAIIRRTWLTKIFVFGDVISLFAQVIGAAAQIDKPEMGKNIVIAGLIIQLIFFALFVIAAVIFHVRNARNPTYKSTLPHIRWKLYLTTLYVTGFLILVRSFFRLIEYIQGLDGPLLKSEKYLYIFDGALMLIVFLYMMFFHPAEIGLHLRGVPYVTNGFKLLIPGARTRPQVNGKYQDSLNSPHV